MYIKRIMALFAALAMAAVATLAGTSPATAALGVHTPAEWASIKTVLDSPHDLAFSQNLPASPTALRAKAAGDCPPRENSPFPETLCLWNGYGYEGTIWKIPLSWLFTGGNGLSFTGSGINNTSKGWWNRSYQWVTMYDNAVCQDSGWIRELAPNQFAVSDDASSNDWENRISSASYHVNRGYACTSNPNE